MKTQPIRALVAFARRGLRATAGRAGGGTGRRVQATSGGSRRRVPTAGETAVASQPPTPPPAYPYLRVARAAASWTWLDHQVEAIVLGHTDAAELERGVDLAVFDATGDGPGPLDPGLLDVTIELERRGVPTVLYLDDPADLDQADVGVVRLVATEQPVVGAGAVARLGAERTVLLPPIADLRRCNPVGWEAQPPGEVLLLTGDTAGVALRDHLRAGGLDVDLLRPAPGAEGAVAAASRARRYRVAVVDADAAKAGATGAATAALLASGTPVVTTDDGGDNLPTAVRTVPSGRLVSELRDVVDSADAREIASIQGRRHALMAHGHRTRLELLLDAAGIPRRPPPCVSALANLRQLSHLPNVLANARRQTHPRVELVLVTDDVDAVEDMLAADPVDATVTVVAAPPHATPGDRLNAALDAAGGDLVARFDADVVYGPHHLTDLRLALEYSQADLVGKHEVFEHVVSEHRTRRRSGSVPERDQQRLPGRGLCLRRDTARRFGFLRRDPGPDRGLGRRILADGGRLYATHGYDLLTIRRDHPRADDGSTARDDAASMADALPFGDGGVPVPTLTSLFPPEL